MVHHETVKSFSIFYRSIWNTWQLLDTPLVLELNAPCNAQQTRVYMGMNMAMVRLSAVPVTRHQRVTVHINVWLSQSQNLGIIWVWMLMALQPNINLNLPHNGRRYPTTQSADSITFCTGRQFHPNLMCIYSFHNTQEPQLWVQVLTVCTNIFLIMYIVLKCWKHSSTVHFSLAEEITLSTKMRLDISVWW